MPFLWKNYLKVINLYFHWCNFWLPVYVLEVRTIKLPCSLRIGVVHVNIVGWNMTPNRSIQPCLLMCICSSHFRCRVQYFKHLTHQIVSNYSNQYFILRSLHDVTMCICMTTNSNQDNKFFHYHVEINIVVHVYFALLFIYLHDFLYR